jgi:DNA-cytosine methyltransferase
MEAINVLSLFDGISCGQLALQRAGIPVNQYFASEIDKNAIKVTQHNWPNTIQLGSVVDVKAENLPKIDLLIGGSPCQSFSIAGNKEGFDGKSGLFFEWLRLLKEIQPKHFLLENVLMKKEWQDKITELVGVEPQMISSSNFSAQARERLYWTNIPYELILPQNNLFLSNVLEREVDSKYSLLNNYKLKCLKNGEARIKVLETNYRHKHKTSKQNPVLVSEVVGDTPSGRSRQTDRLYSSLSKSPTLLANRACDLKIDCGSSSMENWRTLTPVEAERLQTVPDNYTSCIPDNKRYHALGNGWTVDVIAHILKNIQ